MHRKRRVVACSAAVRRPPAARSDWPRVDARCQLAAIACRSMVDNGHVAFIWSIADLLRGDYKQSEYGRVILPLVVLRRLDAVLEPTKDAVLAEYAKSGNVPLLLRRAAGEN